MDMYIKQHYEGACEVIAVINGDKKVVFSGSYIECKMFIEDCNEDFA